MTTSRMKEAVRPAAGRTWRMSRVAVAVLVIGSFALVGARASVADASAPVTRTTVDQATVDFDSSCTGRQLFINSGVIRQGWRTVRL
jgi:hypothetical protein